MCGIAGQIRLDKSKVLDYSEVEKMLQIIKHRGPDGQGIYNDDANIFGMRRLSIIDLTTGWQPLYNEDKSIVCCCNGEIYNYKELRSELEQRGHSFYTHSDVEVILHLYEEYDEKFVEYLNGMFAIALLDKNKEKVIIYRDRLGKKPLFYSVQNGIFYFSSEIKSIVLCKGIERKCNIEALDFLLSYNYIPNNMTAFQNVHKLMPGEFITIQDGKFQIEKYWELECTTTDEANCDEESIINEIVELLDDSTKLRLRSDVPVGAFLSGGVDSSLIVATASKFQDHTHTFSIGFKEDEYNELPYSSLVAEQYKTNHIQKVVDSAFFELLPTTIWLNDNPHGDISFLPTFVLAKLTSEHVKTVLTGDGGDELFGGYSKYLGFVDNEEVSYRQFYENTSVFSKEEKEKLYSSQMKQQIGEMDCLDYIDELVENANGDPNKDRLNTLLYLETKLLLDGNNLVKPDRMGMGNSIEARMPLLDYRLVEFVAKLPSSLKIKDHETKYLLKKVASCVLPDEIVYRKKQMFTVPIGEWLKDSLKDTAYEILLDSRTTQRNLFNTEYVKTMLDLHTSGKANYTRQLRLLIIIELWHRMYIDEFYEEMPTIEQLL